MRLRIKKPDFEYRFEVMERERTINLSLTKGVAIGKQVIKVLNVRCVRFKYYY